MILLSESGTRPRPEHVIRRDRLVTVILHTTGAQPLSQILERTTAHLASIGDPTVVKSDDVYRSLWRLRTQGHVAKVNVGSRTPHWELTPDGVNYALQIEAEDAAASGVEVPQPPQPVAAV